MKVVIVLDGETAEDLSAVGVDDIVNHFLPKGKIGVINKSDIKKVMITDATPDTFLNGGKFHEELYERKDKNNG